MPISMHMLLGGGRNQAEIVLSHLVSWILLFIYYLFGATLGGAQFLILMQFLGITPGSAQGAYAMLGNKLGLTFPCSINLVFKLSKVST